jgi:hypothetical protein
MRPWVACGVGLFGLALVVPGVVYAESRVAPLVPQVSPPVAVEIGERFQDALVRGLAQVAGVAVVSPVEVRQVLANPDLVNCNSASCLSDIAARLRAPRLVSCEVQIIGKAYAIRLRLFDEFGREASRVEQRCEICTLAEAEETIARAAAALGPRLIAVAALASTPPPVLPPASSPAAPTSPPATAASPWVSATTPVATASAPGLSERVRGWNWRLIGLISAGVAVVGLGVGTPLAVIANEPTCNRPDARHTCPEIYRTAGASAAFLTLGILAAGASGTSFYLGWRFGRERAVTVAPSAGSRGAGVSTRWQW